MTITFNKIPFGWLAAGIAILYILWLQTCNTPRPTTVIKTIRDTVRVAEKNTEKRISDIQAHSSRLMDSITLLKAGNKKLEKNISIANANTTVLANELADARLKKDTAKYYEKCDSLEARVRDYVYLYDDALRHLDSERTANLRLLDLKDTVIAEQGRSRERLTAGFNAAMAAAQRNILYGGISLLGNKQTQGIGPEAEYVTKRGYTYGAGAYIMNGQPMLFKIGMKKIISFRNVRNNN